MNLEEFYRFQARFARLNLADAPRAAADHLLRSRGGGRAGAFSFALASDIRVVSRDARFCAAYINIGLGGADMSCSYFLPPDDRGAGRTYEFMYTGEFF